MAEAQERLHGTKKAEFLINKVQLEARYATAMAINVATPIPDITTALFDFLDAYKKILPNTTDRIIRETGFDPAKSKRIFDAKVRRLVRDGVLPAEVAGFIQQKEDLDLFNENSRLEGLKVALVSSTEAEYLANRAAIAAPWQTELAAQFLAIEAKFKQIKDKIVPAAATEKIENPAEVLVPQAGAIDWTILFTPNATYGTPIKELRVAGKGVKTADSEAYFKTTVDTAAVKVDAKQPLDVADVKELSRILQILTKNLNLFKTQPDILQPLVVARTVISELLDRNQINQTHLDLANAPSQDEYDKLQIKAFYQRPTTELAAGVPYTSVEGRDESKVFVDLLGRENIDRIEEIGLRLFGTPTKKVLSPQEVTFLKTIAIDIKKRADEYPALFKQFSAQFTANPDLADAQSKAEQVAARYTSWIEFLLKETGNELDLESSSSGGPLRAPEQVAAQEVWKEFFVNVARGPNPLVNIEKWGGTIMTAFYRSATPTESFKSPTDLKRFSAWKDGVRQVAKEKESRGEADFREFYYLTIKLDSIRKVTDEMITHSQSRGMTSNWHREDARKLLKDTSVAEHEFTPNTVDFFMDPIDDTETGQDKMVYHFAEQYTKAKDRMKNLRKTPGSPYYGRKWQENNSSKVAMKDQVRKEIRTLYPLATYPDLKDSDIDELVDVAYTVLTFAGFGSDAEGELIAAGYSPAGLIADRMPGYAIAPIIPTMYAAYEAPKYLPEFQMVYPPVDYLNKMLARQSKAPGDDNYQRIFSIRKSIAGTQLALEHHAPIRTEYDPHHIHMKKFNYEVVDAASPTGKRKRTFEYPEDAHGHRPFGYTIDTWSDGMLRWPYPSMYRFIFEPEYIELRRKNGYTFETWVAGYDAFLAFREAAYPDNMSVKGMSEQDAIKHLMDLFNKVVGTISKIKSNMMVDWNYVLVLTVGLRDRMFLALHEEHLEGAIDEIDNQLIIAFGGPKDWKRQAKSAGYSLLTQGVGTKIAAEMDALYPPGATGSGANAGGGNNKFNSAGEIDMWRLLPADLRPAVPPARREDRFHSFAAVGLWAMLDYTTPGRERRDGHYHLSEAAFVHSMPFIHDTLETLEHPDLQGFLNENPTFGPTINVLGTSVEQQKKTAAEAVAKK